MGARQHTELPETDLIREKKLDKIARAARWHEAFGQPPPALDRRVAQACLTYRLQEKRFGGLSKDTARKLAALEPATPASAPRPVPTRRYRAGTRLMRTWRGRTYVVTIASPGYLYEGRSYASLSIIAREITGTAWSGPKFFGLKAKARVGDSH